MIKQILCLSLVALLASCNKDTPTHKSSEPTGTSTTNTTASGNPLDGKYTGVILQSFSWGNYRDARWASLERQADEISPYFSLIWVPQSGKAKSNPSMGYDVLYYFNQNSTFGSEANLRKMIQSYKDRNVGIIADVVINHRETVSSWTDFPQETYKGKDYTMTYVDITSDDEAARNGYQVGPNPDYKGSDYWNWDGMRDLDHTSTHVQSITKDYLSYLLNDLGYTGFRYDLVKGYDPKYTAMYNQHAKPGFSVGEYFDASYDAIKGWIDGTTANGKPQSAAFDFPLKFQINEAVNNGNWERLMWTNQVINKAQPAGLIHMNTLRPYAVTFVENHDTGRDEAGHNGNIIRRNIVAANAFILSMPGTPCVFYPHWKTYKEEIKKLIKARQAAGVHNESEVDVLATNHDVYAAKSTGLYGSLVVKVGPQDFTAPTGYTLVTSGENYAVWLDEAANARYNR